LTNGALKLNSIAGSKSIVPTSIIDAGRLALRPTLSRFLPEDIYNADETSLFYRQLPLKSFVKPGDKKKKPKQAMERITVLFSCSLAGEKLEPLIIGNYN
jgi:hypothetical protein